jgi:hypothetical protein
MASHLWHGEQYTMTASRPLAWGDLCYLAAAVLVAATSVAFAVDDKSWSTSPYRVQLHLAVESAANPGMISAEQLARQIDQRIQANISPLWNTELIVHQGSQKTKLFNHLHELEGYKEDYPSTFDKQLFLTLKARLDGVRIACRERDNFTGRWTSPLEKTVRQELLLSEQCFALICETFAPLAIVRLDTTDEQRVFLDLKGADLVQQSGEQLFVSQGAVYQPFFVRSKPSANSSTSRIIEVPWTYLAVEELKAAAWQGLIYSGTRRPFGVRRRAGIEIKALAIKMPLPATRVRFHASHDKSLSLAGYEVFEKLPTDGEFAPLAVTDQQGIVSVTCGDAPIKWLALRSDSQLLAQVPVAPGSAPQIEIPIADDVARLLVQEMLTSFKEQLIDVVARRNILIARTRDQLQQGNSQQARKLLDEIGDLPTRANLDRSLGSIEGNPAHRSANPRVQAKIDRLLADSRKLLGNFLSTREILELETEVNASGQSTADISPSP